jgi:hypothetical protein
MISICCFALINLRGRIIATDWNCIFDMGSHLHPRLGGNFDPNKDRYMAGVGLVVAVGTAVVVNHLRSASLSAFRRILHNMAVLPCFDMAEAQRLEADFCKHLGEVLGHYSLEVVLR